MKTILFLINGFGTEKKESYSVYDANIMPNFDKLMKKYMFSTLNSDVKNINNAYRNMSLEVNGLYNYNIYSREFVDNKIVNNETFLDIQKEFNERKSKLHLFCFVDTSLQIVDNLKDFLKNINKEKDKKVFLHLVLTSNNYQDYPSIIEVLSKINIELQGYATIGMVLGLSNLLNSVSQVDMNFFLRNMITELGEKWQSFKQKLDVEYGMKTSPLSTKAFVVNTGFSVTNNDLFMIWNYDNVDISNFINGVKSIDYKEVPNTIKFYSLFPITYKESIPHLLEFEVAKRSLATNMKTLGFKSVVISKKSDISGINYYLNGMEMVNNPDITYLGIEDILYNKEIVVNLINKYEQELIIINYSVEEAKTIEELQDILKNIDDVLGAIYDNSEKNSYNIIVSSLYSTDRVLENKSGEICNVLFNKVPIIYCNNFITKKEYLLNEGNISDLLKVCYMSINKKYNGTTIIEKKNFLYRLLFK